LHVEGFYADMKRDGVGPVAMRSAADVLCGVLTYAVKRKLIPHTPAAGVAKPPAPKREPLFLTAAQAQTLLAAAQGLPCCCLLSVALGTGCRQGELLALAWDAIDLDAGTLAVRRALTWTKAGGFELKEPKSKASRRTVMLPPFALAALHSHRAGQAKAGLLGSPVFCTRDGGWLSRRNVLRSLEAVIDRVNDPQRNRKGGRRKKDAPPPTPRERLKVVPDGLRFHDLRHSHASILLSAGQSLRAVSARLGHADPAMTLRVYGHCMPADDARLAEAIGAAMG
jgi:integrase